MNYPRFYERNLPHWQPDEVTFTVTFRLAGSLPSHVIKSLIWDQQQSLRKIKQEEDQLNIKYPEGIPALLQKELEERRNKARIIYKGKYDDLLDNPASGPLWLKNPEIAEIVAESIHYSANQLHRYDLIAYCIMPNHVHLMITNVKPVLHVVLQSLKTYTARTCNLKLKRTGKAFWQRESYDHIIRSEKEFQHQFAYILNNPVKAGLVGDWQDWPFIWAYFME